MITGATADDHAMCDIMKSRENGGTPAATIRESQTMWDAGNLSHDFNILMNSTSFPTNLGITLLGLCTMVKTK